MKHQLEIGDAKVTAGIHYEDMGGENAGECCWNVSVGDLRRIFARFPKLETFDIIPEAIGDAIENNESHTVAETLADLAESDTIYMRSADAGIALLAAMGYMGGEWSLDWHGENATWFFHDVDHACNDTGMEGGRPGIVRIDADSERRAQVNGAREALKAGVSIDDVCEAIASILTEYETRFKGESLNGIWSDVFQGFKVAK